LIQRSDKTSKCKTKVIMSSIEILSETTVTPSGGVLYRCKHVSTSTKTDMIFAVFLPSVYKVSSINIPAIYWLSGLTCTDQNFCQKAGSTAFLEADKNNIAFVLPDTSPRGDTIPSDDGYDLGTGAGFYINATNEPWSNNYQMESYITSELPSLVEDKWGVGKIAKSICGHSMGGHGALTLALKCPKGFWTSVSAFSPICHPTKCPWGIKAFTNYLGSVDAGIAHDATELILSSSDKASMYDEILIDEGTNDEFKTSKQLLLEDFEEACTKMGQKLVSRHQPGFDHSYHFIAAFIGDHIRFHGKKLRTAVRTKSLACEVSPGTDYIGQPIPCKAMVARGPKQPLVCENITVDPPKAGEVRVKVIANALCHTDLYTLDG
jgi:S-(hydroxymethyl)glutathione dehydrogenase / alcohol dehydrogenase